MSHTHERPDVERVLDELGWLRALARELCADPHTADDAVQETMTAALQSRPDLGRPVRGWLATVLQNALRGARRTSTRRSARERTAARRESMPSAAELALRVELQQSLLQAVQELPEPLRATVVLRYLDGLPPRHIAAKQNVPVATVKARLQRGIAELRMRLDTQHGGDRRAWVAAVAGIQPLVGIVMSKQVMFGGGAVLATLLLACVALFWNEVPAAPAVLSTTSAAGAVIEPPPPTPASERANDRTALAVALPEARAAEQTAIEVVRGIVVDCHGAPLAGLHVRGADRRTRTITDTAGRFALPSSDLGAGIVVDESGWTTVLTGNGERGVRDSIVVAARAIAVRGLVVATNGPPVAGARVALELPNTLRGSLPFVLDDSNPLPIETLADATGAFALPTLPAVEGSTLRASSQGFAPAIVPLPKAGAQAMRIALAPAATTQTSLSGIVIDRTGRRKAGALVVLGNHSAGTKDDGAFTIDPGSSPQAGAEIVAVAKGSLPGRVAAIGIDARGVARWPEPLVVQLGGPTLAISGRVLRADGSPAAGVRVWVNGLAFLGRRDDPAHPEVVRDCYLENELRGADEGWQPLPTDADGSFHIDGLCDRSYHVTAMDQGSVLRVDQEQVAAGTTDLVLQFDAAAVLADVHGRVTDRSGRALSDILVRVSTDAYAQWRNGYQTGTWMESGATAKTDADGRFVVHDLPRQRAYLRFDGDDVLPTALGQGLPAWPFAATEELQVVMARRCHFQVELLDPTIADELELLDGDGTAVRLSEFQGGSSMSGVRFGIANGRSSALATTDAAQTLVLFKNDKEVRRAAIVLVPAQLTVVRL